MKSISKTFSQLKFNKLEKCNSKPGYKDSCEGCKNCKKGKGLVYEEECDCEIDPINYFDNVTDASIIISDDICITGIVCPITLEIKFEADDGWNASGVVRLNLPNAAFYLDRNQWFSFTVNNNDCFNIEFVYDSSKAIRIHLKNHTCNDNYGEIGVLAVMYT